MIDDIQRPSSNNVEYKNYLLKAHEHLKILRV